MIDEELPAGKRMFELSGGAGDAKTSMLTHVVHRTNREKEPRLHSHVVLMDTTLSPQNSLMVLETGPV